MLSPNDFYGYQREATLHALTHPDSMLWLGTGLGKTACALTAVVDRQRADLLRGTLILGPLRVVQSVWRKEARKWTHLQHLRFSLIHGDKMTRRRAMFARADVHLINYENLSWFAGELDHYFLSRGEPIPWNMVVYDEVTKLKNSTSVRMNGGKRDITNPRTGAETTITKIGWRKFIDQFDYRIGLTGTPASNGYLDLHGQFLAVDGGKRLGPRKTAYRENYFAQDWNGWGYRVTDVGRQQIESRIHDITLKMDTKDYRNDIPDAVTSDIMVTLPPKAMKVYKDMEKDMFAELEENREIEVFNGAAAAMKCLQIANSAIYTPERLPDDAEHTASPLGRKEWVKVHDAKLDALEDVIEEAGGNPVLVSYAFKSDAARIMERFKKLNPVNLTAEPASRTEAIIQRWQQGSIQLMIAHPASAGHGIDGLQDTGNIVVWFGLTYSLELYDQMNARLDRTGQKRPVSIVRILAEGTIDLAVAGALRAKATDEASLKSAIDAYRRGADPNISFA